MLPLPICGLSCIEREKNLCLLLRSNNHVVRRSTLLSPSASHLSSSFLPENIGACL